MSWNSYCRLSARAAILCVAIGLLLAPGVSDATVLFRFDPATSDQWAPGSEQIVEIQMRTDDGDLDVGGIQIDFLYDNSANGVSLTGIDTSAIASGQMSEDYTDATDDGDASLFRAVSFIGGGDTGYPIGSAWETIAELSFTVATAPSYPLNVDVDLYAALDLEFTTIETEWDGTPIGGEYDNKTTAIELVSFEAEMQDGAVLVSWETATEQDNAGFHLWRSDRAGGDYERLTASLIPAEGDGFTGAVYSLTDDQVEPGQTYFYKLEDIDVAGRSTFHGPVDATVDAEPSAGCGVANGSGGGIFALLLLAFTAFGLRRAAVRCSSRLAASR